MQSNWYETYFHGVALELWRKAVTEEQTTAEADFIAGVLDLPTGARILDVPCGNGRHSLALAKRGSRMTGVDMCEEFIDEARQASEISGLNIDFVRTDMRNLETLGIFDGAFCFGNSFGYMLHHETLNFLEAVYRCLRPGARFILETGFAAESILPAVPGKRWYRLGDVFQLSEAEYDPSESLLYVHYTLIHGTKIQQETARYSLYTIAELKRLFSACGFTVRDLYSSTNKEPFRLANGRLLIVAEKEQQP
jgi:SAM-dependent methyltransferase